MADDKKDGDKPPPRGPVPSAPPSRDLSWQKHVYSQPEDPPAKPEELSVGEWAERMLEIMRQPKPPPEAGADKPPPVPQHTSDLSRETIVANTTTTTIRPFTPEAPKPPPTPIAGTAESSLRDDVIAGVIGALIAAPLCDASWHAIVTEAEYTRGIVGLSFGLPIGIAGLSFHWWKNKILWRYWFARTAPYWIPALVLLVFIYVTGPEVYRRATAPLPPPSVGGPVVPNPIPAPLQVPAASAPSIPAAPTPPVVIHDPPTAEEIAKAGGDALRAVAAERDALKEQNNLLRQKVPNPPPPPAPPRPKPMISDLLAESGTLLDVVKKTLVPLEKEWREILGGQNPERICIGVSSGSLQDEATSLSGRLRAADKSILDILEQNRIDRKELAPLIDYPIQPDETRLSGLADYLDQYKQQIAGFGDHPTCEALIKADASYRYREMTGQLNSFNQWVLQANERLSDYRDALRKELRNAP
jgi:hypothetical protein